VRWILIQDSQAPTLQMLNRRHTERSGRLCLGGRREWLLWIRDIGHLAGRK